MQVPSADRSIRLRSFQRDSKLVEPFLRRGRGRARHRIRAAGGLRERRHVPDVRLAGEQCDEPVDAKGEPAALEDRCCHRTAKLSKGWCRNGNIVCGYHGWEYDRDGMLVMIPQFPFEQPIPDARARAFRTKTRYGYVWVALDEPLRDIPDIPEDSDPAYRRIFQFYDTWNTAALRLMENSFDNAHFAFVHKNTFGDIDQPRPEKYEIVETDYGFEAETIVTVKNPPIAAKISGTTEPYTKRHMRNKWFMPFCRRLDMEYPSGIRHIIFNCATPIADGKIQVVQLLFRNDTEADCSTQELIDWDAAIIAVAAELGCHTIYTEDLSHDQNYDGITVVNPFRIDITSLGPSVS